MKMKNDFLGYFISIKEKKEYIIYSNEDIPHSVIDCLKRNKFNTERIFLHWQINKKETINGFIKFITNALNGFTSLQKFCFFIIIIMVIIAINIVIDGHVPSNPYVVSVFSVPIYDDAVFDKIITRIKQEKIKYNITPYNNINVTDVLAARRIRTILVNEGIIDADIIPRIRNFRDEKQRMIVMYIKSFESVNDVNVDIKWSENLFFYEEMQSSVSMIINLKPEDTIIENSKFIYNLLVILKFTIPYLSDENIFIFDQAGNLLNKYSNY